MNAISTVYRGVAKAADATTAAAGAVGGAAINGVIGGVQGTVSGVRTGLNRGSHSPAAAALTLGAIGAAGLVEWPLLVTVGGAALVVHQLNRHSGNNESTPAQGSASVERPAKATAPPRKAAARRTAARTTAARSATKATNKPAGSPRKSTAARRTASK